MLNSLKKKGNRNKLAGFSCISITHGKFLFFIIFFLLITSFWHRLFKEDLFHYDEADKSLERSCKT